MPIIYELQIKLFSSQKIRQKDVFILFSENLKTIRKTWGLSQIAFGEQLGVTRGQAGSYEQGIATPKIEVLLNLSKQCGLSINKLFEERLKSADINPSPIDGKKVDVKTRLIDAGIDKQLIIDDLRRTIELQSKLIKAYEEKLENAKRH